MRDVPLQPGTEQLHVEVYVVARDLVPKHLPGARLSRKEHRLVLGDWIYPQAKVLRDEIAKDVRRHFHWLEFAKSKSGLRQARLDMGHQKFFGSVNIIVRFDNLLGRAH